MFFGSIVERGKRCTNFTLVSSIFLANNKSPSPSHRILIISDRGLLSNSNRTRDYTLDTGAAADVEDLGPTKLACQHATASTPLMIRDLPSIPAATSLNDRRLSATGHSQITAGLPRDRSIEP